MADIISNWLLGHCPEFVRAVGSMSPWAVLALTVAICTALVIGNRGINAALSGGHRPHKPRQSPSRVPSAVRQLLRDEEPFDPSWMDAYLVALADKDERRVAR